MDMRNLVVGSRIEHGRYGSGVVTFVGADYIGIAFDGANEALIRRESLEKDAPAAVEPQAPARETLPWPTSTFIPDGEDAQHYLGSHWDPFVEDVKELMARLPEIVPNAMAQTGFGESRKPSRLLPADWPKGGQLVWPLRVQGMALILRVEKGANMIVSLFPFFAAAASIP
jgi:hypothetical protein